MTTTVIALVAVTAVVGLALGFALYRFFARRAGANQLARAQEEARRLLAEAEKEADTIRRERIEKAEEDLSRRRHQLERESEEGSRELRRATEKLNQRNAALNRRTQRVNERENALHKGAEAVTELRRAIEAIHRESDAMRSETASLLADLRERHERAAAHESEVEQLKAALGLQREKLELAGEEQIRKLEQISGLGKNEAREELLNQLVEEAKLEAASRIKETRDELRLRANREARRIVLNAIQRSASSHTIENTVSVVNIQSDEMKGRIIGREGRNIRAFEAATGIEVIVDDTPEAVILSGFNPVRREVARLSLTRLIQDGRIHPARIEEVVGKAQEEIDDEIRETGERAVIETDLHGVHPALIQLVGRMRYRSSYGQNLLSHSIETANIASLLAAELGLDAAKARRAGLLHDIGKVDEEDIENPHAIVGMKLCKKYKEDSEVCNAVGAHHDEIEMTSLLAPIVQAADAISGARPGARREALEAYIKRLEKLEEMASSFDGVLRVFAIQAGREIRVLVNHDIVSDARAEQLAIEISRKIEQEMQYPGQIKVTVIREVRSVSYAK